MVTRRRVAALVASVAALVPATALACPQCAGRAGGGVGQAVLLAGFVLLPFAIVGAVIRYIRSEARGADFPRPDQTS
jgi:hypothetical protein